MKIAVVGAGLGGLAVTYFLLQAGADVTVFDMGLGASMASTGLLHPYPGKEAKRSWRADEGMRAAKELLEIAGPVFNDRGILRIAVTDQQRLDFKEQSTDYIPKAISAPAMWIPEGVAVYSRPYLLGLWKACSKAKRVEQLVSLEDLSEFDLIILACGAGIFQFPECKHLPLKATIGQSLICRWTEPLAFALLASGHITPTEHPDFCQVGSTYEHTPDPDPKKALALLDKCAQFYPPAKDFQILEIRCGVRVSPRIGYKPIVEQINSKTWVFTGLGSRGLLYHAMLAKELVFNNLHIS